MEISVGAVQCDSPSTSAGDKNSTENQARAAKRQNKKLKKKIQKGKSTDNFGENGQADGFSTSDECFLEENHLIQMQKLVPNNRPSVYKCTLCTILLDSIKIINQHIKDDRHICNVEHFKQTAHLKLLEEPPTNILTYLEIILERTISSIMLQPSDHDKRLLLATKINKIVQYLNPDLSVEVYGSALTGFGLRDSNLNLNLSVPNEGVGQIVFELLAKLQSASFARNVQLDFGSNLPRIKFTDMELGLECDITFNDYNSVLFSNLLVQYKNVDKRVTQLVILFRYWAKICGIDRADIGMLPTCSLDVLVIYYLQKSKRPLLPVITYQEKEKRYKFYQNWKVRNDMTIGRLWIGLFKYFSLDLHLREFTVNLATRTFMKKKAKIWSQNIVSIEEPGSSKRNLGNTMVNHISFKYLQNCLSETFKYFSTPQSTHGPICSRICAVTDLSKSQIEEKESVVKKLLAEDVRFNLSSETHDKVILTKLCKTLVLTPPHAMLLGKNLQRHHMKYEFSRQNFTGGMDIPVACITCHEEGHKSLECTKGLVPLEILPVRSDSFFQLLSNVCIFTEKNLAITMEEIEERKRIVKELEYYISHVFPEVHLQLFGSTFNGFGLYNSDLDICLTFSSGFTLPNLINKLVAHLRRCTLVTNLLPITTARVPIVKFTHCETKLDGDISIYNVLAQRNTQMLRLYSEIDHRAKILGFVMKRFAKLCNIGDASRGSLSSYAYILIVIYFLQQCTPPVLPVLQEIDCEKATVGDIISSCNTYFYSDIKNLHLKWPYYGMNSTPVGKLWLELLYFYSETFDFENYVISIRQKHPLLKFEKMWKSKFIKIEDPFDLNHNLGSALSKNMHNFILNTFRKGRNHFGTASENALFNLSAVALESFFFNEKKLTPGKVPADKVCFLCKKIGHMAKTCHLRNQSSAQFTELNHEDRRRSNGDRLNTTTFQKSKVNNNPKESNYVETRVFANKSYVHDHRPFGNQAQKSDLNAGNAGKMTRSQRRAFHFRNGKVDMPGGLPTRNFEFINTGVYTQAELATTNNIEKKLANLGKNFFFDRKKHKHNMNNLQPRAYDVETSSNTSVSTAVMDIKVPT